ncbi:UEV-domain-containing protein [Violaceomyces palustris]|uniref:UEV-domain-containing protein n=1 Tax=Violaceomyces palustris TaxID=1673888 RepID=A0ACD0P8Q1_9BASI|nr:UEV-domain-containing protein [Violaceomyces palustris]
MDHTVVQRWLRSVLGPYQDQDRVFSDVDRTLIAVSSLAPKTQVFTYNDGRTQLLLTLTGTIPINFRGATYNIPVAYWIPREYPREPPMAFVVPTQEMLVRRGKNVDVSGQVSGDYLSRWSSKPEGCNLLDLIHQCQQMFGQEPPVYAKPKNTAVPSPVSPTPRASVSPSSSSVANGRSAHSRSDPRERPPPPAPEAGRSTRGEAEGQSPQIPAKPPKPGDRPTSVYHLAYDQQQTPVPFNGMASPSYGSLNGRGHHLAPAPAPLPRANNQPERSSSMSGPTMPSRSASLDYPQSGVPYQPGFGPPPPMPPATNGSLEQRIVSSVSLPQSPRSEAASRGQQPWLEVRRSSQTMKSQSWTHDASNPRLAYEQSPPPPPLVQNGHYVPHQQPIQPPQPPPSNSHLQQQRPAFDSNPQPSANESALLKTVQQRDLLDSLEDELESSKVGPDQEASAAAAAPPPPRPPNPELLRLHSQLYDKISSRLSALGSSLEQSNAQLSILSQDLDRGAPAIQDEMQRLEAVKDVCKATGDRLEKAVVEAKDRISNLRSREEGVEVDDLVCATSIVGNQLLELVAEDNAIEDTLYQLARALNEERIDCERFLKQTRMLAREQFMKRALALKICQGMGWSE